MSNTRYEVIEGDYLDAIAKFRSSGGRFYPQLNPDSPSTIVSGNRCIVVWNPLSKMLPRCKQLCREFGFEWEGQPPGRIARRILKEVVALDVGETGYAGKYRSMARSGHHWHYTHVETGYHPYLVEFDLKSAYFTSLFQGASLLYHDHRGFLDDGGALANLKAIEPIIPKFLRLVMLGILASHKHQFYTIAEDSEDSFSLKLCTANEIKFGAAFNAAHKAVYRTYALMKKIHSIGGEYIKRMHTDSFALSPDIPHSTENEIFSMLHRNNYPTQVKAQGTSHFINLNEGIIGNKLVGAKEIVLNQFREQKIKIPKYELDQDQFERWTNRRLEEESTVDQIEENRQTQQKAFTQLGLDLYMTQLRA